MAKQLNVDMRFTADTVKAKQAITELQTAIQKLGYGTASKDIVNPAQFEQASAAARELAYHLNNAYNAKTGNLDLSKLNASLKQSGTDLGKLTANFKNAGAAGQQAFVSLANAIANADQPAISLNTHLSTMLTTIKNVARFQISSSLIHGFIGGIQKAYGYAQDLNQSLNNIRIVTGQSTEQMAKFAAQANKTARSLSATTLDYTDAALIYYQQGLSDEAVKARTDVTVKLANVSRQSAEEVSSQMTAIWENFDAGAHSMEYFADVITALGATTASSSEEIAQGLQKFAPVAGTIGLSYEKATSVLAAIVANTRQSADTVGTGLRTIFSRFESLKLGETLEDGIDLNKYTKAMQTIGVNVLDANGKLRDMDSILDDVAANWEKLNNTQKTAFATTVGGVRQYTNLMALFENWDDVQKNMLTATESEGTLQKQADIYAESWEAARDRVKTAAEGLYSSLIDEKFFINVDNMIEHILVGINKFLENFGGVKALFVSVLSFVASMVANKIGPAVQKVVQDIQIMSGGAAKIYGKIQNDFNSTVNEELASGKYDNSPVMMAELRSSESLLAAKTKLGLISDQLSAKEKMRAEIAIQGLQLQAEQVKKLAQEEEKLRVEEEKAQKAYENAVSTAEKANTAAQTTKSQATTTRANLQGGLKNQTAYITNQNIEAYSDRMRSSYEKYVGQQLNAGTINYQESINLLNQFDQELRDTEARARDSAQKIKEALIDGIKGGSGADIKNILSGLFDFDSLTTNINTDNLDIMKDKIHVLEQALVGIKNKIPGLSDAFKEISTAKTPDEFIAGIEKLQAACKRGAVEGKDLANALKSMGLDPNKVTAYTRAVKEEQEAIEAVKEAQQKLNNLKSGDKEKSAEAKALAEAHEKVKQKEAERLKLEKEMANNAAAFNPTHTITALESITKTAAGLGQTAMLINSVKSAIQTMGDESATAGEKISALFMATSMGIPALIGLYGNFGTVLNGFINNLAASGTLGEKLTTHLYANGVAAEFQAAGYTKSSAAITGEVIAKNVDLFTTENLKKELDAYNADKSLGPALSVLVAGGLSAEDAAKTADLIITKKLTVANIALKMSMIEIIAIIAAIVAVAAGLYALFDWLIVTPKEAAEAIEQATESYDKAKEAVTNLNSELETTKNRIDELNNKDSLTIVESQELAKLQSQNALLESQLAIKKEIAKTESKQLYKTFSENYQNALSKEMAAVTGTAQNLELASTNRVQRGMFAGRTDITNWDDYISAYRQELIDAGVEDSTLLGFFRGKNTFDLYKDTIDKNNIAEDFNVTEEQIGVIYKILNDYQKVSNFDDFELFGTSSLEDIEKAQEAYDKARSNAQAKLDEYTPQYLNLLEDYADGVLELTDEQFTNLTNGFAEMTKTAIGEDLYTANYLAQANNYGNFNNITGADIARGQILYTKDQKIDLARRNIGIDQYNDYLNDLYQEVTSFEGIDLDLVSLLNIEELATVADYVRANNTQAVNELLNAYNNLNTAKDTLKSSFSEQQIGTIQELISKIDWSDSEAGFEKLIENLQLLGYKTDGAEGALWDFINAINGVKNAAGGSKKTGITLDTSEQAYDRYEQAHKSLQDLRQFGGTWGDDEVFIKASDEDIKNAELEFIAARDAYLDAIETEINNEIKEFGLDVEEVNNIRDYLADHLDDYQIAETADPLSLKEIAKDIAKAQKAIDKASDSMEDWKKALNSKDIKTISTAIGELKETYGELLDIGSENITSGFAEDEENLKLLEDYINGDAEAYDKLREKAHEAMKEKIESRLDNTDNDNDGITQLGEFESKYGDVKTALAEMNFEALQAGANLEQAFKDIDDPTIDNSSFLAALTEMVNAAGMTAEEATDYLSSMGIDATVEQDTEEIPGETLAYNITPTITPRSESLAFGDGAPLTYEFPQVTYDKTPVVGDPKKVPVGALNVTSANKSSGGNIKKKGGSGSGGGGGGGGSSSKTHSTKARDGGDRYKPIRAKQEDKTRQIDQARNRAGRLAGKVRIDNLKEENKLLGENIALQQQYINEINNYLAQDKSDMLSKFGDFGISFNFDENGVINNYDSIMDKMYAIYNEKANQELDEDTWDAFEEEWQAAIDALEQYIETRDLAEEETANLTDMINEQFDKLLEITATKLELNLQVNDQDLKFLDYLLNKIDDDAYKAAEAIALMGDKAARELERANYYQNAINQTLAAYGIDSMEQLANMSPEELQNLGITQDTINNLIDWNNELLSTAETLDELQSEIIDKVISGFDDLNEKVQDSYDYFSHWNTVLENYRDIVDLNMSALGGKQARDLIKTIDNSMLKNSVNALRSSKQIYDDLVKGRAEAEAKLQEAVAAGRIGDIKRYEDVLADIDEKIKDSQEQWLSDWSDGLQKAQDILTRAVEDAVAEYDKLLSPVYGSLDYLNEAYDRGKEVDEDYVQDYEKLYQLNKLNRDLTKVLNDTDGVKNREQLIKLQEKINKLQKDKTKMSEYDLEVLRKEFEVQQARIALEEAANAKSTVRLQRDNEGNWGYVYTSDFDSTEELQQSYEDKLHEYQQLNDEYMSEMSDQLMELSQNARDRISEIWSDATLTQEEKEARVAEVMKWFNAQRDYIEEQMGHAINNQAALTDRFYATYQNMQAEVRDTFAETVLSQTTNIQQLSEMTGLLTTGVANLVEAGRLASLEYLASMQEINEAAGSTMQDLANNITNATNEIDIASSANVETISELSEVVQEELVNALDSAITEEEKLAASIAETTAAIENQTAALNNMLRILNGASGGSIEINSNPLDTLTQSEEKYGINQPAYNENDWLLNKELEEIFDAVYDREKWGQSHNDFLEMYGAISDWLTLLQTQAGSAMQGFGSIMSPYYQTPESETLEQQVHIEASFPGVTNSSEIEEAFENLVNKAAQFANRKRQG